MFTNQLQWAYPIIKETVPRSSLGYATNNQYPEFPPLMSDGRSVTASWQPEAVINEDIIKTNHIESNWQYRKYLTNNAKEIMETHFRESCNDVGYYKRAIQLTAVAQCQHTNPPYSYTSNLDATKPMGHSSSDLKDLYLSREQLDARRISPVVTQDQLIAMQRR